jgi:hypothetical protein
VPLGYGVAVQAGVIAESWSAAEHLAARFGPAAGLLPYGIGTLLLAAPVAWGPSGPRGVAVKRERAGK